MTIVYMMVFGLFALYLGAELLVRYSAHLASLVGMSPLVIGLTIVAFGTSAPEMTVNIIASLSGNTDIAVGNIVGSNIFNVLFILGISAMITPLTIHKQIIRLDVPVMIVASLMVWGTCLLNIINAWIGFSFICCMILYTLFIASKAQKDHSQDEFKKKFEINIKKTNPH